MIIDVRTKVSNAATEVGVYAGKKYVDDYFKDKNPASGQSSSVSSTSAKQSVSSQSVIDETLKILPSTSTVHKSKLRLYEQQQHHLLLRIQILNPSNRSLHYMI